MAASASSDRIGQIEQRLEQLEAKVDALGPDQSAEIRTSTRRHMRLLHEEVIGRIAMPGESLSSERSPSPAGVPKP
jgi:hypothetical protein